MIDESNILKLDREKPAAVRAKIAQLVSKGRDLRFLTLSRDGKVLYDREAH